MNENLRELSSVTKRVNGIVSPAWAVGGCVRDALRDVPASDYDFCTLLVPDDIEAAVRAAGRKPYLVGKRFGTVGFKLPGDEAEQAAGAPMRYVEVTTFRTEAYEPGSRKPQVGFVDSLEEDLSRRDFTVNAMAFDGEQLADPFDGQGDLERRIIRAVGDPVERLSEDPLRIMRAARFAAQLGFEIDEELADAMVSQRLALATVSHERWAAEMDKLLCAQSPGAGLDALLNCGALRLIVPELASFSQLGRDLWDAMLAHVAEAPATPEARWAALLEGTGLAAGAATEAEVVAVSHEVAERTGLGLHWSKERIAAVLGLVDAEG